MRRRALADEVHVRSLRLEHITYRVGERTILKDISTEVTRGELVAVVGRNGAGKSTLLHLMTGLLTAHEGTVTLEGQPLYQFRRKDIARRIALLPQQARITFGFPVHDIVRMGRHPHRGRFRPASPRDEAMVHHAMEMTSITCLAHRLITEVSGGERQLALLAQALAQEPRFLLLDEPTANLDVAHQYQVMQLLQRLAGDGMGVVAVMHDLSLAVRCFPRLILLDGGALVGDGPATEVLTAEMIRRVFQVRARFHWDEEDGSPVLWFAVSRSGQPDRLARRSPYHPT
jgi:iron complex transport system ATP-binding protein